MKRFVAAAAAVVLLYGCGSSAPPRTVRPDELKGNAGWVGQEFAGRTTANGEIFDPMQLTAAHRTLPFGSIVTVKNPKSGQTVRVRINDRGPYISNRVIDLSYAAAKRIGLVDTGGGAVEIALVKLGQGDKEPPAPYVVSVPEVKPLPQQSLDVPMAPAATSDAPPSMTVPEMKPASQPQPAAEVPSAVTAIAATTPQPTPTPTPAPVETRRQVSPDGTRIENIPVRPAVTVPQPPPPPPVTPQPAARRAASANGRYAVQVGAYSQPANAQQAMNDIMRLGEPAFTDRKRLLVVCAGPYETLADAQRARDRLARAGQDAIIIRH